jgi:hypothetical protein
MVRNQISQYTNILAAAIVLSMIFWLAGCNGTGSGLSSASDSTAITTPITTWPNPNEISVAKAYNTVFLTELGGLPYDTTSLEGLNSLVADHGGAMQTDWNPVVDDIRNVVVLVDDTADAATFGILVAGSVRVPIYVPGPWTSPSRGWINDPFGIIGSDWASRVIDIPALLQANNFPTDSSFEFYVGSDILNSSNTYRIENNGTNGGFLLAYNGSGLAGGDRDANEPIIYVNAPLSAPGGCNGLRPTIIGTPQRDVIKATSDADVIMSLDGNDVIYGYDGNDVLCGGDGDDVIFGGNGDDVIIDTAGKNKLLGEAGDDLIIGGDDHDVIDGGFGNDILYGGGGDDTMLGDIGDDVLYGQAGNDTMTGGIGNDILNGGEGDDIITGDSGNDLLNGGPGNDKLVGNGGDDIMNGNEGDDKLYGFSGNDTLDGGVGNDICAGGSGTNTASNCETTLN